MHLVHLARTPSSIVYGKPLQAVGRWYCSSGLLPGFQPYTLLSQRSVSPDSKVLRFEVPGGGCLGGMGRTAPTGVKVQLPGTTLEKSYSPVSHPGEEGIFDLLVKAYPPRDGGGLGSFLCGLQVGETAPMKIKGSGFSLLGGGVVHPNRWKRLGLLANGTGIAPLLQVALQLLSATEDETQISIIYTNRREEDILMHEELEQMTRNYGKRLAVFHTLTSPGADWAGARGRPDEELLRRGLPPPGPDTMLLVCGTDAFVSDMAGPVQRVRTPEGKKKKVQGELCGLLKGLGYKASMVHKF